MQRILLCSLLVLIAFLGGTCFYFSQALSPGAVPKKVIAAENALASAGAIAFASIDMDYVARIEGALFDKADPNPILNPESDTSFLVDLVSSIKQTDFSVVAFKVMEKDVGFTSVSFGKYSADKIKEFIKQKYTILEENDRFWLIERNIGVPESEETCLVTDMRKFKQNHPYAIVIKSDVIVVSSPPLIVDFLDRYEKKSKNDVDLTLWQNFRRDKVFAAAILSPKDFINGSSYRANAMFIDAVSKNPISAMYAGVGINIIHPKGVQLVVDTHATTPDWPKKTKLDFDEWKNEAVRSIDKVSSLASIIRSLSVDVKQNILQIRAVADENTLSNLKKIPQEIVEILFSRLGVNNSGQQLKVGVETIADADDLPKFFPTYSLSSLPEFDATDVFYKPDVTSGPFGIRISEIGLLDTDESVLQINVDAEGKGFYNISSESMFQNHDNPPVSIRILSAEDINGDNLLREELCGNNRNLDPSNIQEYKDSSFVDGKWIANGTKLAGNKIIRLKKNVRLSQLYRLKGEIKVEAASEVKRTVVVKPFSGKLIETDEFRIYFKPGHDNAVEYELSGKDNYLLAVYGKNAKGQYLASAGRSFMRSEIISVSNKYQGKVDTIEVVYATQRESKVYPFEINKFPPRYGDKSIGVKTKIIPTSKSDFLKKHQVPEYKNDCVNVAAVKLGPFMLCMEGFGNPWGSNIQGQFSVYAPTSEALKDSLNTIEINIDKLIDKAGSTHEVEMTQSSGFTTFSYETKYNKVTKQYKTLNERIRATNISVKSDTKDIKSSDVEIIKGTLIIKLPKNMHGVQLKANGLGKIVKGKNGLIAKISKFNGWSTYIDVQGHAENIIQLAALDKNGVELNTRNDRVAKKEHITFGMTNEEKAIIKDRPETWEAMFTIYGNPETLEIRYTDKFEVIEYPFEFDVK